MKKQHPNQGAVYILFQQVEGHDGGAEDHQHHAGGAVQRFGFGLVGKERGAAGSGQGGDDAENQGGQIGRAADGHVGGRAGEGGKGHNEYAGANGGLQFVPQHAGKHQQHHHAAARAHEATDEANDDTADHRLDGTLFGGDTQHGLLGGHNGTDDELDAQQERHDHGEASHGAGGHQAGDVAACHGEQKHGDHHNDAVPDIQVLVFAVGVGGDGAGQHVGGQSDAYRHVGVHAQKCDEHGTDDRRGAHARKAGAEARAHAGEKGD